MLDGLRGSGRGSRELALLVALKLAVSVAVIALGFEGVSDDDFSRVAIAQNFAHAPTLDPGGPMWLPLPFWLNGAVMMVFGKDLTVARVLAVLLGIASVLIVRTAAEWLTKDRAVAFVSAAIVAVLPWSVRLGVSTVPELPATACSLLALAALPAGTDPRRRIWGAAALLVATLSRYEPWFLAAGFVAILAYEAVRARKLDASRAIACGLAVAGPIAWSIWNQHAYGDPLRYLHDVAAYRESIDRGAMFGRAFDYLRATFRAEPELLAVAALLIVNHWKRARDLTMFAPFARPAAVLAFVFIMLTMSSIQGGAPTHHPERAVYVIHLTLALLTASILVHAIRTSSLPDWRTAIGALALLVPTLVVLRAWVLYRESFAHRRDEVAIGRDVARLVPAEQRVLVQVTDYGYFAVEAGAARPWSFVPSGEVEPGRAMELAKVDALVESARSKGIGYLVATAAEAPVDVAIVSCRRSWCLYAVE